MERTHRILLMAAIGVAALFASLYITEKVADSMVGICQSCGNAAWKSGYANGTNDLFNSIQMNHIITFDNGTNAIYSDSGCRAACDDLMESMGCG